MIEKLIKGAFRQDAFKNKVYNYKIYFKKINLVFIDVPKCACSTVKSILIRNEFKLPANKNVAIGHPNWSRNYPSLVISDEEAKNVNLRKVAIIRNPYKRLKSAYVNICLERGVNITFESFVYSLPDLMEKTLNDYPNNHFRPCSHFINIDDAEVFKLETLDRFMDYLKKSGVSSQYIDGKTRVNKSNYDKVEKVFYSKKMLEIVNKIYEEDFSLGKYKIHQNELYI